VLASPFSVLSGFGASGFAAKPTCLPEISSSGPMMHAASLHRRAIEFFRVASINVIDSAAVRV
jgi:hypothetical protein